MDNIEFNIVKDSIKTAYSRIKEYENNKTEQNKYYMEEEIGCFISFVVANRNVLMGRE